MSDTTDQGNLKTPHPSHEVEDPNLVLFKETNDGIFIADRHGQHISVNPRATEMTGYSCEELLDMAISDVFLPKDTIRTDDLSKDATAMNNSHIRRKDGRLLPIEFKSVMLTDGGQLRIVSDISKRAVAEDSLRSRTQQLDAFKLVTSEITRELDLTRLLGLIHRRAAELLAVKSGFLLLYDETTQILTPRSWEGHGDWVSGLSFRIGEGISGTVAAQRCGMVVNDYQNSKYTVPLIRNNSTVTSVIASPLIYRDRLVGVVTVDNQGSEYRSFTEEDLSALNIFATQAAIAIENARLFEAVRLELSERIRAEGALQESEQRFRTLAKAAFEGIAVTEKGVFLDVNDQLTRLVGFDREELIGRPIELIIAPESREAVRQARESRKVEPFEHLMLRKDGSKFPVEIRARYASMIGREVRIAAIRDITERKNAEEESRTLQNQLQQAMKMEAVGLFAGGLAHDFNNVLTAILGHAELAMMSCDPADPIFAKLKAIEKSALRSADLVSQLLAFARKQTIAPTVMHLNHTISGLLEMLQRLIGEDIEFTCLPVKGLWLVNVDPSQVDQILVNLCVNARDAIHGVGHIILETRNVVFDEEYCSLHHGFIPGEYVMLAVSDDGCGIDKDVIEHIFEPFFTTKALGMGTGLGLAIAYGIVKQNKGFINVYSEPGKGTTFKIYFPRFEGARIRCATVKSEKMPKAHGETVLLVEDEPLILEASQAMLEKLGYGVLSAGSPSEALRICKTHTGAIQLLITDVILPEMNGRTLSELLKAIRPSLKCLYSSGYTANVIAHRGVLEEGVNFLPKPFFMKDLAVKVRQALERN